MKFIALHLPIEAGKHNMHTDSEELSDSVSSDDGRPVDCNCCCVSSFFKGHICPFAHLCVTGPVVRTGRRAVCVSVWQRRGFLTGFLRSDAL